MVDAKKNNNKNGGQQTGDLLGWIRDTLIISNADDN